MQSSRNGDFRWVDFSGRSTAKLLDIKLHIGQDSKQTCDVALPEGLNSKAWC